MLNEYQSELVKQLREEAYQVKECAVQYFVRAIMFTTAYLGFVVAMIKFGGDYGTYYLYGSIMVLPILFATSKIILHKYATANRNLGYELHLERSRHFSDLYNSKHSWDDSFGNIGWEEAMRAWRIVQCSIFEAICEKKYNQYREEMKNIEYPWFDVKRLAKKNNLSETASYYAGSFLKNTLSILHVLVVVSLLLVLIAVISSIEKGNIIAAGIGSFVLILSTIYAYGVVKFNRGRLMQLESGVLSISSCSVVWHAVILAHYRGLRSRKKFKKYKRTLDNGYSFNVSVQARRLADNIGEIHSWIEGDWLRKDERTYSKKDREIHLIEPFEATVKVSDYSYGGFGGVYFSSKELKVGSILVFSEKDVPKGIVKHIGRSKVKDITRVGVMFDLREVLDASSNNDDCPAMTTMEMGI